ncbi:restriction endonuclease type i hsds [Trichococcus palustris]|uniref:Restriction endonuclease type i hsds n=1 Tax=Trichococcus palustris TaxID=140314 RepID=A0A143YCR1_9LACT|nr:restriction endonuclease subunit S [Trichococcus palustris]CZQ85639.1 restriction endonuclease type i hsds [Trichococcus palustris]SFK56471.1 Type I restriction modification DNA specificity domain-containing protein [Trichococcus palustris]
MRYQIDEIAKLQPGQLLTRITEVNDPNAIGYVVYSGKHFLTDSFQHESDDGKQDKIIRTDETVMLAEQGMLLISLTTNKAAIVSTEHEGHLLTSNYVRVAYDANKIDPNYFCYVYNESDEVKKQIAMNEQGASLVSRLSLQQLRKFELFCPPLEDQHRVGAIYRLQQKRELLKLEKSKLEKLAVHALLNKYLQGRK